MRIVSLNIWQGKLKDPLIDFLKREAPATDIFCFQEMTSTLSPTADNIDIFSLVAKSLPGFQGFFEGTQEEKEAEVGLATFIKRSDPVDKEGDFFVYKTRNAMVGEDWRTWGRNVQFVQFPKGGKEFAVVNFHGLANGADREDNPDRLAQSEKLKKFLNALPGTKVVCGDFNLTRDTKSLAMIDEGMRNLIKEAGITSTRNHYFPYPDKFCDYILVDQAVNVASFKVLDDEISDHLALTIEFD